MIDQKSLSGILNSDDPNTNIPSSQHKMAYNVKFRGMPGNMRPENVNGTTQITVDFPGGTNTPIGTFYDQLRRRIIWFNHNNQSNHGIYQYSLETGVASSIFVCNTDSATDILRFNLQYPIHSCVIVYRTETDGDLLYWTDNNIEDENHPRYLNLATVSDLAPFTEDMINAAKNAPSQRAICTYGNDTTRPTNTLKKKLFQFRYRWVYKNGEKSTLSPYSRMALPNNYSDNDTENEPTNNNYINIIVRTGGSDVQKLEIIGRESLGTEYGDDFLITTIDKDDYTFNPNATYSYNFYNDSFYVNVLLSESSLLFDWLPDYAEALELLNGNVLIYGGITDGEDQILKDNIDVSITTDLGNVDAPLITYSFDGLTNITVVIGTEIITGTAYNVIFSYVSGLSGDSSPKNDTYVTLVSDSRNDIALGLKALIEGQNVTVTSISDGVIRISVPFGGTISNVSVSTNYSGSENATPSWPYYGQFKMALAYFKDTMKTNGAISFTGDASLNSDFSITMPEFSASGSQVLIPYISAAINHTPPEWATSYQWLITKNLLSSNDLYHVSCDYQSDTDFIYVCIQNLYYLQTKNTGFVPTYEFSKGDRIKIIASYSAGNYTPYSIQLDYEILGVEERTMTDPATAGLFLKMNNPVTVPSAPYTENMLIYIYTPSISNGESEEIYYEFGETYSIYESGGQRYHTGGETNQTATQPATFLFFKGDVYFKTRRLFLLVDDADTVPAQLMDRNFNDYYSSAVNSYGRAWIIDPNIEQTIYPATIRWGGAFQDNTNINNLNRFYPENFSDYDRAKGAIKRMKARDRILRIFQERGVGQVGIYAKFLQNNSGESILTTTDSIITSDNIQYYDGEYGVGNQPCGLVSSSNADYFSDPVRGYQIRLAPDGMTVLNVLYKGQFYIRNLLTPYNKTWSRPDGSYAKILGCYDFFEEQYITILQSGARYDNSNPFEVVLNGNSNSIVSPTTAVFIEIIASASYIVAFNGTPLKGDLIQIEAESVNGQTGSYSASILNGWALTDLKSALITEVNSEDFFTGLGADQSGNPGLSITNDLTSNIVDADTSTTITHPVYVATFKGTCVVNDLIVVVLTTTNGDAATYQYRVLQNDTLSSAITNIISVINAGVVFTATAVTTGGYSGFYVENDAGYQVTGSVTIAHPNNSFLSPYTFSFNEQRNGYCSFYEYYPEWMICAQDVLYSWFNGAFYVHDNTEAYCNFYGSQFFPSIKLVFNDKVNVKKTYNAIGYESEGKHWVSDDIGDVNTSYINEQTRLRQLSNLLDIDYESEENLLTAAFNNDANSEGGENEGDTLKGVWVEVKLTYKGSESAFIYMPYINWSVSQRNF